MIAERRRPRPVIPAAYEFSRNWECPYLLVDRSGTAMTRRAEGEGAEVITLNLIEPVGGGRRAGRQVWGRGCREGRRTSQYSWRAWSAWVPDARGRRCGRPFGSEQPSQGAGLSDHTCGTVARKQLGFK